MAVDTRDAIFSLTPPPSDIDERDKSGLLTCSPTLTSLCYPSPAPSNREHTSSISSDSLFLLPELSILDHQTQHLHDMAYNTSSSDSSSYYALPAVSDPSMSHYTTTSGGSYAMYEHNNWYPYSTYSQPAQMLPYDPSNSSQFPALDHQTVQPALANIIPPTPQDIQRSPFDFNSAPSTLPSNHHLTASPSFSQVSRHSSHSHRSSISSMSRSCSPSATSYQQRARALSGDHFDLRGSLRSNSTSSNTSLHAYGIPVNEAPLLLPSTSLSPQSGSQGQAWRCAYPGCTSRATFTRGCDLRKHYNRHSKHLFCRVEGCPQSEAAAAGRAKSSDQPLSGGFSSKKDRARHEAKHNPGIKCEWRGPEGEECGRVFSRMDNMKDHVRRIHNKGQSQQQQQISPRHSHGQGPSRK
ncbi:uncharacterized protein A1O9_08673 [Exophiala aquamarina CBS 119918]|uniref:C2H2-type domain-containing protein n=1 Tax=Exophiala aquamarina CBS 119918 TaxID=1182545 RepID=A0A072PHJ7_9EURO|nr:uncharacterized protein A1O9_08673 [Exophiala aquamarina CBS 119918]KEF55020.1 hypothetical protein A1O9_08673 [Exophiala aquamarina CBS 119918]